MSDELHLLEATNSFLLGNYQASLKSMQKIQTNDADMQHKIDVLTYRVYIAQKKYGVVLDEISPNTDVTELKLLRLMARYFSGSKDDSVLAELDTISSGTLSIEDSTAVVLAATLYMNMGKYESALKILNQGNDPYSSVMTIQCLLSINRYDLAGKTVRRMQTADEDSLICQLAMALYYLAKGGEQLQEAHHIYQELREKYGATTLLLNGQAAALIGMNQWDEAESMLQESLDLDSNNPETLVNMIVVHQHLGKPIEAINRLVSQLKECCKDHPFLVEYMAKDEEFTRHAQQYAPSVPS